MKNLDPGNPNWLFLSMIRDYQALIDYRPLKMTDAVIENRICVCVRKRPLSKSETTKKEIEVITVPNKVASYSINFNITGAEIYALEWRSKTYCVLKRKVTKMRFLPKNDSFWSKNVRGIRI